MSNQKYYLCAYLMQTFPVCPAVEVGDCGSSDCNQGMVLSTIFLVYFFTLSFVSSVRQPTHSTGENELATKENIIILKDASFLACPLYNIYSFFRTEKSRHKKCGSGHTWFTDPTAPAHGGRRGDPTLPVGRRGTLGLDHCKSNGNTKSGLLSIEFVHTQHINQNNHHGTPFPDNNEWV